MKRKILILADSGALPRSFPKKHASRYEETYPYLLREAFPEADVCSVAFGGSTSTDLVRNAVAYFDAWSPDVVIIQCGAADCTPLPVSPVMTQAFVEYKLLHRLGAFVYRPDIASRLIRFRARDRVSLERFKKNIEKLRFVFSESQLLWLEIFTSASGELEQSRPGIVKRMEIYNAAVAAAVGDRGLVRIQDKVNRAHGVHEDHVHLNRSGHAAVFEVLSERVRQSIGAVTAGLARPVVAAVGE